MRIGKRHLAVIFLVAFLVAPFPVVDAGGPWDRLDGFALIPDSPARLDERYIAALFVNEEKQQLAVVVFNASCGRDRCDLRRRAAYSIFDSEGLNVGRYVDPNEHEIMRLVSGGLSA